ncbi:MAG: AbrB/MazE/SpoVT family DNA-binding domain-containing protein [Nanoarchaeota archaeon]
MEDAEITNMSSRGQVVIPQALRNRMKLKEGERFLVLGDKGTILLKRIEMPKLKNFDKLLEKTQNFVKLKGITEKDVKQVINRVRT